METTNALLFFFFRDKRRMHKSFVFTLFIFTAIRFVQERENTQLRWVKSEKLDVLGSVKKQTRCITSSSF